MADDTPTRRLDPDEEPTVRGLGTGQRVFGRYGLRRPLGRGGMGVVWLADDEVLGEPVALKFLPELVAGDPEAVEELKIETRRARRLTHPHIVRIHDFVQEGPAAAVSMEYVEGRTLGQMRLEQPGRVFAPETLGPLVSQLCVALEYAHAEAKVAHRDLKPANVLVTSSGRVKVTDFGIARSLSETHTRLTGRTAGTSGTLPYMSPQQLAGDRPTAADDLYSLGAMLYELLSGRPPFFRGEGAGLIAQIRERQPEPLAQRRAEWAAQNEWTAPLPPIPPAWEETIRCCLAKEAAGRPASAAAVAQRLGLVPPAAETRGRTAEKPERPGPRRRGRILALAGIALVLAVAAALQWRGWTGSVPTPVAPPAELKALAANRVIRVYPVSNHPVPGGRYVDTAGFPKVGYIGDTPSLVFSRLQSVRLDTDAQGRNFVDFSLRPDDTRLFAAFTQANVGRTVLIMLGDQPLVAVRMMDPITAGQVRLGENSITDARRLVSALKPMTRSGP